MLKRLSLLLLLPALALAAVPWSLDQINRSAVTVPASPRPRVSASPRLFSADYLNEVQQTCNFVARLQFPDSSKPDSFGGVIECENVPDTIETDNTQEAIWIWTRWYELTGHDDYRTNIRRAWSYVMLHPAYRKGSGPQAWYSIWNCGLAFFAEAEYRHVYGDSGHLAYTDTCRQFLYANPLSFASNTLYGNVTAFVAGMTYRYAHDRGDNVLLDTALAYGNRVKTWVEQSPARLRTGNWAMSGGTLLWGLCSSVWQADTVQGKTWLQVYADSVPYFMPSGEWNCSWNLWDAFGFRAAWSITHEDRYLQYHHHLTDTLLGIDENSDDDGGIPATWTDPATLDQSWVSSYLDFMGMDFYVYPAYNRDAAVFGLAGVDPNHIYLQGDSITLQVIAFNAGRDTISFPVVLQLKDQRESLQVNALPFLKAETLDFGRVPLESAGQFPIAAWSNLAGDPNHANDTASVTIRVFKLRNISGTLFDSASALPVMAWLQLFFPGDTLPYVTTATDSSGVFSFRAIDSSMLLHVNPQIPYPNRVIPVTILSDTSLRFGIPVANILLVDNDSLARYESYFTSSFDTLLLDYSIWRRRSNGPIPAQAISRLAQRPIVWYTGQTMTRTLDDSDTAILGQYLDAGGKLFITGQNIGQELGGTPFYQRRLHAWLVDTNFLSYYLYPVNADSVGSQFHKSMTVGQNGANDQNSRDEIAPDSLAHTFLVYDSATTDGAAIWYHDPAKGSKVIYLAYGFEAINRQSNHPEYMSRVTFFNQCYNWFMGLTGIADPGLRVSVSPCLRVSVLPSISTGTFRFIVSGLRSGLPSPVLRIYNTAGREVAVRCSPLTATSQSTISKLQSVIINRGLYSAPCTLYSVFCTLPSPPLPTGVYLYRLTSGSNVRTGTLLLVR